MTLRNRPQYSGPPPPITKLTHEQDFKIRQLEIFTSKPDCRKEDIITILLALQRQNFVMANSLQNLVAQWPDETQLQYILPTIGIIETPPPQ